MSKNQTSQNNNVQNLQQKKIIQELQLIYIYIQMYREKCVLYIYLILIQRQLNEIRESLKLKVELCRYDERYQNNLALFRTRGKLLKSMRKIIKEQVKNQPICTGVFDTKQHILRNHYSFFYNIRLHFEPEQNASILVDDRVIYLKEEEKTEKKSDVQYLPWKMYKKKQLENNQIIYIENVEYIKID